MGNHLVHFNICASSYIVTATDFHLQKIFELYKIKLEKHNNRDSNVDSKAKVNYILDMKTMQRLLTEANINKPGEDPSCLAAT